jgi:hypothetical protein
MTLFQAFPANANDIFMWQPRMLFAAAGRGKSGKWLFTYFGILVFCVV